MIGSPVHIGFDGDGNWDTEGIIGGWGSKNVEEPSKCGPWNTEWQVDGEEAEISSSEAIGKDSLYSEYCYRFFP